MQSPTIIGVAKKIAMVWTWLPPTVCFRDACRHPISTHRRHPHTHHLCLAWWEWTICTTPHTILSWLFGWPLILMMLEVCWRWGMGWAWEWRCQYWQTLQCTLDWGGFNNQHKGGRQRTWFHLWGAVCFICSTLTYVIVLLWTKDNYEYHLILCSGAYFILLATNVHHKENTNRHSSSFPYTSVSCSHDNTM